MLSKILNFFCVRSCTAQAVQPFVGTALPSGAPVGIIAGNGQLPFRFVERARLAGHRVVAVCYEGETDPALTDLVDASIWIKLGELGSLIQGLHDNAVKHVVILGGINRIKHFNQIKLDARGALLLLKIRSMKDDALLRGITAEIESEGIAVLPCTTFFEETLVNLGTLTVSGPTKDEQQDIAVGASALKALSSEHIGQLVVIRNGVIVAVEAVEGSDKAILRGGELGGAGTVVVKCAKVGQDLRFDLPTVGMKTLDTLAASQARVLALEAGKCMLLDRPQFIERANSMGIAVVGIPSLAEIPPTA